MFWAVFVAFAAFAAYRYFRKPIPADKTVGAIKPLEPDSVIPPLKVPPTGTFSPRHQIAGIVESVHWCNDITRICWPHICKVIEAQLSPTLEPLVNLYLPKPFSKFHIIKAKLGSHPLTVDRVIVHRRFHDSIALDLDVNFRGSPNVTMKCAPLNAPFGIKELRWSGRLSVLMRPLLPRLPLVGAIQAAMVTHPQLEMDFTGIANLADIGPVARIVHHVLKKVIASMIVLPNRFLYKLSNSVDYFDVYQPPIGVMRVIIERGRNFTKEKKLGMIKAIPDLYCRATFGLEEVKTEVQMNKLEPVWNKSKEFILSDLEQPFQLKCYDKDTISSDDLAGSFVLTAQQLLENEAKWYRFQDNISNRIALKGEIFVSAQLFVFKPPGEVINGKCVLSVLVDRAENLPIDTRAAACRVVVGPSKKKIVSETPQIMRPPEPIPGIDPVNPIWNFSFDYLLDDHTTADVLLDVVDGRKPLGQVRISAAQLEADGATAYGGRFPINNGASLRAKVIMRGLLPEKPPPRAPAAAS